MGDLQERSKQGHMPGSRKKKSKRPAAEHDRGRPELRRGMPAHDSVQDVVDFVSPHGVPYRILKTNEMDAYDPPRQAHKKRRKPRAK